MSKAHSDYERKEFELKDIRLKVDDLEEEDPKVQKIEMKPVADNIDTITINPTKKIEKTRKVDGAKYTTEEKVQKKRSELPDFVEQLVQVLAENDTVTVIGSFHNWDQSADEEEDNDMDLYYVEERQYDDWVVAPHSEEEDEGDDSDEEETVIK